MKQGPQWFLKLKYILSVLCLTSLGALLYILECYPLQKVENDPYRLYIPKQNDILKWSIKPQEK